MYVILNSSFLSKKITGTKLRYWYVGLVRSSQTFVLEYVFRNKNSSTKFIPHREHVSQNMKLKIS